MENNSVCVVKVDPLLIIQYYKELCLGLFQALNTCCVVIFHFDVLNMLQRKNSDMLFQVTNQFFVNDWFQLGPNSPLVSEVASCFGPSLLRSVIRLV